LARTMAKVAAASGLSRDTINKWMERRVLSTPISATTNGVARIFTRENALEIAFTGALARTGTDPELGAAMARAWIEEEKLGRLPRYWAMNPLLPSRSVFRDLSFEGDMSVGGLAMSLSDEEEGEQVASDAGPDQTPPALASALVVIDRSEIVRRIDRLGQDA
jgi:hypothetical protein